MNLTQDNSMTTKRILFPCSYFSQFLKTLSLGIFFIKVVKNIFFNFYKLQAMSILLFIWFEVILVGRFLVVIGKNTKTIQEIEGMYI